MTPEDKRRRDLVIGTLDTQLRAVLKRWGEDAIFDIPLIAELTDEDDNEPIQSNVLRTEEATRATAGKHTGTDQEGPSMHHPRWRSKLRWS